jgi:catechol 2,3-dioxygenase-like lactoylglutathione lyase family enzyme
VPGRLIAFLAISKPARAREFYDGKLGLRLVADEEFALGFDAGGTEFRLQKVDEVRPPAGTALGWQVEDIDAAVDGLQVDFERSDSLEQDERRIWTAPSGARVAWFSDPDGNILSLTEPP